MTTSLSTKLESLIEKPILPSDKHPTIGEIFDSLGSESYGFSILILSLPSALPIPAGGFSTPLGIVIALLGLQMIFRRSSPWLPQKALNTTVKPEFAKKMFSSCNWFLKKVERFICPRYNFAITSTFTGVVIFLLAFIMALPIPLTNTAPAMVLFLISISMIENDGLLWLLAMLVGILGITIYGTIFYIVLIHGHGVLYTIADSIHRFFGGGA